MAVEWLMLPVLLEQQRDEEAQTIPATRHDVERSQRLADRLAVPAENFSRTVWITFHARGITSSVSVTSSPRLHSRLPPRVGQEHGAGTTTRSRGRCSGNGFLAGRLRSKAVTVAVFSAATSAAKSSTAASASRSSSCNSIWSRSRRVRSPLAPYYSRLSLAICSLRFTHSVRAAA